MLTTNSSLPKEAFLNQVLACNPRVAVFDCDGTLWSNNSGTDFMYWEIEQGLLSKPVAEELLRRYDRYLQGEVSEVDMCGEMVSCHAGISSADIAEAAVCFSKQHIEPNIFFVMLELVKRLREQGCDLWAVSSTYNLVVREGVIPFGINPLQVLGVELVYKDGVATSELVAIPTDELKAQALEKNGLPHPDVVFGNSIHDLAMLDIARNPFAINPNQDLRAIFEQRGWPIYQPV